MRPDVALIGAMCVVLMAVPAAAGARVRETAAEQRLIARCIHQSARGKPWLEKTLLALRHQEGGWIGAEVRNHDGSYDLGPMQINSWWVPRFAKLVSQPLPAVKKWLRQDACFNVEAARWILLTELTRSGDYWEMIGRYHSPRASRRLRYVAAIVKRVATRSDQRDREIFFGQSLK